MSFLKIQNISKSFSKTPVLKDINFELNKGEIVAFLGNSGCGKSTLLRIIAGFETSDSGIVDFDNINLLQLPSHKRNVGMFFQNYALFPHLNVEDNIAYGLKSDSKQRVKELLNICNLNGQEKKLIHQISGGQQQRVALARALAPKPKLLLLDEPFSNIDGLLKDKLRSELKAMIKAADVSAIFVSHDIDDAFSIADKALILHDGIIQQFDTPEKLYRFPKSTFVAEFMGNAIQFDGQIENQKLISSEGLSFDLKCEAENIPNGHFILRKEDLLLNKNNNSSFKVEQIEFKRTHKAITLKDTKTGKTLVADVNKDYPISMDENYSIQINQYHKL